jgi:uncharacterized protein
MIIRKLSEIVRAKALKIPVISITGPRQSGKTTLVKQAFPDYSYVNLENLSDRVYASRDPEGFLRSFSGGVVLDEVQNVPGLFSAIQVAVDKSGLNGQYILTGSQNFLLLEKIAQSLAGRISIYNLLPFSYSEIQRNEYGQRTTAEYILEGFYPRIYDQKLNATDWLNDYVKTYVERDVRSILKIGDLTRFHSFLQMCAGRTGQLINLSEMANQLGVSYHTVASWISILEASFIVFLLRPYHRNFNKRIIKSPKLYFYDTGIACLLLGIKTPGHLQSHYASGSLFENLVLSELLKQISHNGHNANLSFFRDSTGNEVDCLLDAGHQLIPVEIKSSQSIHHEFFKGLNLFSKLASPNNENRFLIYGGTEIQNKYDCEILPWTELSRVIKNTGL